MTGETMVPANGVDLCVEWFGEPADPPVLLIAAGRSAMDWWEDEFCRRLAASGRWVIRYDHRDTGRSTSFPAGAPPYTQEDLATDALELLDTLGAAPAHLVGLGLGALLARRIATTRPERVASLAMIAPAPCRPDPASPFDWSDRRAAVSRLVAEVQQHGGPFLADAPRLTRLAERVFDRTADMAASQVNHGLADPVPQEGAVSVPVLVFRGTLDRVSPVTEMPGAREILLEGAGHEYPPQAVWPTMIGELVQSWRRIAA